MLLVGLTGGIGSGKSTVGAMLADRGADLVDADDLSRSAVAPGTDGAESVARRFPGAVSPDGSIDRGRLAAIVFEDGEARRDLEAIVHPEVRRLLGEFVAARQDSDAVVVFAAPLLVETGAAAGFDVLVVVNAPEEVRVSRLVAQRGMDEADARARVAAQASEPERLAAADLVIDNAGPLEALAAQVDALWAELSRRAGR